jgi:hypothetical protein
LARRWALTFSQNRSSSRHFKAASDVILWNNSS